MADVYKQITMAPGRWPCTTTEIKVSLLQQWCGITCCMFLLCLYNMQVCILRCKVYSMHALHVRAVRKTCLYASCCPFPCCRIAGQLLAQQAVQLGLIKADEAAAVTQRSSSSINQNAEAQPGQRRLEHGTSCGDHHMAVSPFSAIFAVGDNPAADIRGANSAGAPWVSVLVRTGVFQGAHNDERDPAHVVVSDVLAAVQAGLHRVRSHKWHSMR